jgi:hypothetical protein
MQVPQITIAEPSVDRDRCIERATDGAATRVRADHQRLAAMTTRLEEYRRRLMLKG